MVENLAHQMAMHLQLAHPMAVNLVHLMAVRWLRAEGLDPRIHEAASGEAALSRRAFSQVYQKKVNNFVASAWTSVRVTLITHYMYL